MVSPPNNPRRARRMPNRAGRVLAVDPSLTATALAVDEGLKHPTTWLIQGVEKLTGLPRLQRIRDGVVTMAQNVELVVIEGYGFAAKQSRQHSLGELGGVLKLALYEAGHRIAIVPPTTLKKFTCGAGNAPKNVMLLHVYKRWGFECSDDNIADAFALWQLGKVLVREPRTKLEHELMKKVEFIEAR